MAGTLDRWQTAGDPRLFKIIISPEFGDRLDLEKLTRELMANMETDLGTRLEWFATIHDNTQFPHVHVALRGIRGDGRGLRLDREYVKQGIRAHAQDAATAQIGYRTQLDAQEAERREIHQQRFTSLDRILDRNRGEGDVEDRGHFSVNLRERKDMVRRYGLQARLLFLNSMGLAEKTGRHSWRVRSDFETVLRAAQCANDRQRSLANHLALVSDNRLQSCVTAISQGEHLEGRVLGHGEEDSSGRTYMLIEGTDHYVHFIYHTPEMHAARQDGKLKPDSFLRINGSSVGPKHPMEIEDLGDANRFLANREYFRRKAQHLIRQGIVPVENGFGGWLGRYEAALAKAAAIIQNKSSDGREILRWSPTRGR